MRYRVVAKGVAAHPERPAKYYANPVHGGRIGLKDLARQLAERSSLTRGDVESVLSNFVDALPAFLKLGMSVQLGELGSMRLNIQSEGAASADTFSASNITGVKLVFQPGVAIKQGLKNLTFEKTA